MFDIVSLLKTVGYLGVFFIVFAESGLFIGFFLPGDSLLFTAGFLASQGFFNIGILILLSFVGAVLGDSVGYAFGRRVGPMIFRRDDSLFFHKDNLLRAQRFYEKHGGKAVVLARFMPVIRTFAPILAGVGTMKYRTFLFYNVFGAVLWAIGLPLTGYYLGTLIPGVDRYIVPIVALIVFLSILPAIIHFTRDREHRHHIIRGIKHTFGFKNYN
ncbi:MAG: VTT domain-containing protein [Candidatus Sungbacteria bacterium]|nr:VTT domain-containing protein [Candidatus Sungbacteria bacterium]